MHQRLLIVGILLGMATGAGAQVGLNASYFKAKDASWYIHSPGDQSAAVALMENGFSLGVNYWFRLKNYRVEFLPELGAGFSETNWTRPDNNSDLTFRHTAINFFFNTQFYLLDIKGDCDCPTFSKEGPTFEKGLFLFLSPGATLLHTRANSATEMADEQTLSFNIGGGIGMDFGVSDFLTITPLLGLRYYPESNLPALEEVKPWLGPNYEFLTTKTLTQYFAGLRVSVRFDYDNRRRR
ncbi:MAG: hypothetical protein HUU01_04595 [Saprospiraceae bacterium]|nr:hypothetical protein [Saprospiraceae bacterium]